MGKTKNTGSIRIAGAHKHANGDVSVDYEGPIGTMAAALARGGVEVTGTFNPYQPGEFDAREANVFGQRASGFDVGGEFAEERAENAGTVRVLFDPYSSERDENGRIRFVEGNDSNAAALYENSRRNNSSITILVAQGLMKQGVPTMQAIGLAMRALQHAASEDIVKEGDERPSSWAQPDEAWFVPQQATDGCNAKPDPMLTPDDVKRQLREAVDLHNMVDELLSVRTRINMLREVRESGVESIEMLHSKGFTRDFGPDNFAVDMTPDEVIDVLTVRENALLARLVEANVDTHYVRPVR